jgi:hypothetical protein
VSDAEDPSIPGRDVLFYSQRLKEFVTLGETTAFDQVAVYY